MPKKKKRRTSHQRTVEQARLLSARSRLEQDRDELMSELSALNRTLERLEVQNTEWTMTIKSMKRSKAMFLNELGRVNRQLQESYEV